MLKLPRQRHVKFVQLPLLGATFGIFIATAIGLNFFNRTPQIAAPVSAATTSATSPVTCVEDTSYPTAGAEQTWTTPGNAVSSNNVYASVSVDGTKSETLKCTNFGFSIPAGSTIDGILVETEVYANSTGNGGSTLSDIFLVKNGTLQTSNLKSSGTISQTTDNNTYLSFGSSSDVWSNTWTASDINSSTFGVGVVAQKASAAGAAHTVTIDHVRITITYTAPTLSGVLYTDDGTTIYNCASSGSVTVAVRIAGAGTYSGTCTTSDGTFTVTTATANTGDVITVFADGAASFKASTVTRRGSSDTLTGINLYKDRVIVRHEDAGPITNTNLGVFDKDNDSDIPFTSNSGSLTVDSGTELHIWTGKTFTPGGAVNTNPTGGDVHIDDGATLTFGTFAHAIGRDIIVDNGSTLTINSDTTVSGGDITTSGTGVVNTTSGTPTVTISGTGSIGGGSGAITFHNFTTSGAGTTTLASVVTVNADLVVGAGTTLTGSNNLTVGGGDIAGDGTINMNAGITTLSGTGNFGGNTNWTFNMLIFNGTTTATGTGSITVSSVLTINVTRTLNAGSKSWILTGSGSPFVQNGTFNAQTSTISYQGTTNTNIYPATYNNIQFSPPSGTPTYTPASTSQGTSLGSAVKISDANNLAGTLQNSSRQILRTSSGVLYVFAKNVGNSTCGIWRSTDGSTWTEQDTANRPVCDTTNSHSVAAAIDSGNIIHALFTYRANGGDGLQYVTFNTSTDLYGTTDTIQTGALGNLVDFVSIAVDSNNKPHAAFYSETSVSGFYYSNKISTSWSSSIEISEYSGPFYYQITIDEDNLPIVVFTNLSNQIATAVGNQNNATSFSSHALGATSSNLLSSSIVVDTSGNTWVSYIAQSTGYVTLAKRNDGNETSQWSTGWTTYTNSNEGISTSLLADGSDIYVFYEDELDDIVYDKYTTSWLGQQSLHAGTLTSAQVRWSFYNNASYSTYGMDFLFSDGTDMWYNKLNLTGGTPVCNSCTITGNNLTLSGTGNITFDVNTTDPIIDFNGNLTIGSGDTFSASNSAALTIAGNFTNNGTFTHNSGTITFDTTGTSTISGSNTTFHNFTSTTAGKTLKFQRHTSNIPTFTINGLLTLTGASGNLLIIESDLAGSQWLINHQGTESVAYVNVKDAGCNGSTDISTTDSTSGGNNGNCWLGLTGGGGSTIVISGFVYADESSTLWTGSGKCDGSTSIISISVNGATKQSTTCNNTTGAFSLNATAPSAANQVIAVFIDGHSTDKGVLYTKNNDTTSAISNITLTVGRVWLTSEGAQGFSNADINTYDAGNDLDIPANSNGTNLTVDIGYELHIPSGKTFTPGGNVTTSKMHVLGTYTGNTETLTLDGSGTGNCTAELATIRPLCVDGGTFSRPSTVNYVGTSGNTTVEGTTYTNLGIGTEADAQTGRTFSFNNNTTIFGTITIGNASSANIDTLHGGSYELTFKGATPWNITAKGQFDPGSSTTLIQGSTIAPGTYNNLVIEPVANDTTHVFATGTTTVQGTFTAGNPTYTGTLIDMSINSTSLVVNGDMVINSNTTLKANAVNTIDVSGDWTNNGVFDNNGGTIVFTSTASGNILSGNLSGTNKFNDVTFDGSGGEWTVNSNLEAEGNFSLTNGTLIQGANNNIFVNGGNVVLAEGTTFTKATGTGKFIMDGPNGTQTFNDQHAVKVDLGNVQIGASPGTTTLASDMSATSLTIPTLDTFNTKGYDVTLTDYFDCQGTCTLDLTDSSPNNEGDGTRISVGGNWTMSSSGTFTPSTTSTIEFDGSANQTITTGGKPFHNVTVNNSGAVTNTVTISGNLTANDLTVTNGVLNLNTNDPITDINDDVIINTNGELSVSNTASITIAGDFSNAGTFTHNSGTITFDTSNPSTIGGGSITFNNVTSTTAGKTLKFQKHTSNVPLITFAGTLTITGTSESRIAIESDTSGSKWLAHFNSSQSSVTFATIKDSGCNTGSATVTSGNSINLGNNDACWQLNTNPNNPSSLTQKKVSNGNIITVNTWINENEVRFEAVASDGDSSDTLSLCIEKDTLVTAFSDTEDSCGTGVSFSGTPVTVYVTISALTDATQYHWQARVKDAAGTYSTWVSFDVNAENQSDFGIDTTAPVVTSALVYDGTTNGTDAEQNNTGSLSSLSANWTGFNNNVSGLNKYQYSVGTTAGGTDKKAWTDHDATESITITGLNLQTSETYYINIRAVDNAENTSNVVSSNGQTVTPTLVFSLSSNNVVFSNLNSQNNYQDSKSVNVTTSTNAHNGYQIKAYRTSLMNNGDGITIPDFSAGTYASPSTWSTNTCSGTSCGFGYTSSDTSVGGANKFDNGTKFAPFSSSGPGDIVADHTETVSGTAVNNESFTITNRVAVSPNQAAGTYTTTVVYTIVPQY